MDHHTTLSKQRWRQVTPLAPGGRARSQGGVASRGRNRASAAVAGGRRGLLGVLGKPLENTGLPATKWVGTASVCNPG